jgi:hypothetical protein
MEIMKKDRSIKKWIQLLIAVLFITIPVGLIAQEETTEAAAPEPEKSESKPVRTPFQAGTLIESQTYVVFPKNTLVFDMQHRFGPLNNNSINTDDFDLGGLYGPSNIRMGLTYVVIENLQIGLGTTKNRLLQDLNWKYSILTQKRENGSPIALTYYGNFVYDASKKSNFEDKYTEYKEIHRISYFHQLIVGRKFTDDLTVQVMFNYAHFNLVDTMQRNPAEPPYANDAKHDNFGIGLGGRYKFSPQGSVMFEYEHPLTTPENIKPNLSIGVEFATSSHAFQIFLTTYSSLVYQHNLANNTNDFTDKGLRLGFNITRNWNF